MIQILQMVDKNQIPGGVIDMLEFKEYINPRNGYGEALVELGKEGRNIVVLDADLSSSTKTAMFAKEFPGRFSTWGLQNRTWLELLRDWQAWDSYLLSAVMLSLPLLESSTRYESQ